jgi:hypothetical protein
MTTASARTEKCSLLYEFLLQSLDVDIAALSLVLAPAYALGQTSPPISIVVIGIRSAAT